VKISHFSVRHARSDDTHTHTSSDGKEGQNDRCLATAGAGINKRRGRRNKRMIVGEDGEIKEEGSAAGAEREQEHGRGKPSLFSSDSSSRSWSPASPSASVEREDFGDSCLRRDAGKMPSRESSSDAESDYSLVHVSLSSEEE